VFALLRRLAVCHESSSRGGAPPPVHTARPDCGSREESRVHRASVQSPIGACVRLQMLRAPIRHATLPRLASCPPSSNQIARISIHASPLRKPRDSAAGRERVQRARPVQMVPIVSAKRDEAKASLPGVLGSLRRSLICADSSPTAPVKSDIASIVPRPKAKR
jgi:hypothetical protein